MHRERKPLPVIITSRSSLGSRYLFELMRKDPTIRPTYNDTLEPSLGSSTVICLLDNTGVGFPLLGYIRRVSERIEKPKFVVIGNKCTDEELQRLMALGVEGYVEESMAPKTLRKALHHVAQGQLWFERHAITHYIRFSADRLSSASQDPITKREFEVLELVKERLSNKEIAGLLKLRESTVKFHVGHILAKFQVGSRYDLLLRTAGNQPARATDAEVNKHPISFTNAG